VLEIFYVRVTDLQNSAQNGLGASLYGVGRPKFGELIALEVPRLYLPLIRIPYIGASKAQFPGRHFAILSVARLPYLTSFIN